MRQYLGNVAVGLRGPGRTPRPRLRRAHLSRPGTSPRLEGSWRGAGSGKTLHLDRGRRGRYGLAALLGGFHVGVREAAEDGVSRPPKLQRLLDVGGSRRLVTEREALDPDLEPQGVARDGVARHRVNHLPGVDGAVRGDLVLVPGLDDPAVRPDLYI